MSRRTYVGSHNERFPNNNFSHWRLVFLEDFGKQRMRGFHGNFNLEWVMMNRLNKFPWTSRIGAMFNVLQALDDASLRILERLMKTKTANAYKNQHTYRCW